ncbi:hypothetical protein SISSUDRAFT_1064088 [Sistotremastrum suecicum HHB10207 ss-3]|uniref:P-loop containing nucleoside triphosphate hydrolase protein n=1 Tax=Sistotremastrum suecicum HHB10207 ss-3 TaxID=1314776 RepID=A0A166B223_9AGAM|nr:hypothetical protein SISSUDRAFT_1064088 [Sistotremastrum suecicum HHB10207 ss-3]
MDDDLYVNGLRGPSTGDEFEESKDPFDVTKPEDAIDGQPLDEDRFWHRMRLRKIIMAIIFALILSLQCVSLGFSITLSEASSIDTKIIITDVLNILFTIYLLVITTLAISYSDIDRHWPSVVHIASLTVSKSLSGVVIALVPGSRISTSAPLRLAVLLSKIVGGEELDSQVVDALWYTTFALYWITAIIAMGTSRGPELHFPSEKIYSEKTLATTTNKDPYNVCGVTDCSPWGFLLFSYSTKVVMLGNKSESLEIGDLPIVPANMRATILYARMKAALLRSALRASPSSHTSSHPPPQSFVKRVVAKVTPSFKSRPGSGWSLIFTLLSLNKTPFIVQTLLAVVGAIFFYAPAFFLQLLVKYLEVGSGREDSDPRWGWSYCLGLFFFNAFITLVTGQLWSLSTTTIQVRLRIQLNTILFAKTLVRKSSASTSSSDSSDPSTSKTAASSTTAIVASAEATGEAEDAAGKDDKSKDEMIGGKEKEDADFSSKAQIMTLMTIDVDRVSEFAWHFFTLVDSPIEIIIGSIFLYNLLGISSLFGLALTCLFLPINHWAGKIVVRAQDGLMKARDERLALMNEVLGGIRMLKFMAWERSFEKRVLGLREKELYFQRRNYIIEALFNMIWATSPVIVTLVSFWHFAYIRQQDLTPSIAFTSITVFSEMKFALNALPETFINMLQSLVSVRRIEKYLASAEVPHVPPFSPSSSSPSSSSSKPKPASEDYIIAANGATITWPQDRAGSSASASASALRTSPGSATSSTAPTPRKNKFVLVDVNLRFPVGELSLICGKLGSGKTLMLLGLLGEADLLTGQVICPRSPPDALASFQVPYIAPDEWIVPGICAYVPQSAWLQNASIKDNILFTLPFDEERYQQTLAACALVSDLKILEDGDESEIGERGVNLSGGQKARVSLARAVYSRASILLLDDVLSAVDAHTARHLFDNCLKGPLMKNRTIILVSHHVQLCAPGASYIVALDNGRVMYAGDRGGFEGSSVMAGLVQQTDPEAKDKDGNKEKEKEKEGQVEKPIEAVAPDSASSEEDQENIATVSSASSTIAAPSESAAKSSEAKTERKAPRKLIEEEKRAVGRISKDIWLTYFSACGNWVYWTIFLFSVLLAAASPVVENNWLKIWAASVESGDERFSTGFYIGVYAAVTIVGVFLSTWRWLVLYFGSIHASTVLYKALLKSVLFAHIRFHDTVSRGRLLNRFGKDFEGIDSSLSDNFGRSLMWGVSALTTICLLTYVGGLPFLLAAIVLAFFYWNVARVYGQTSRDMRRLDSVTRSPLYSIYGETIAGVTVLRAFGAGSKFLRDMLRCVDTNSNPYYWMWGVNRWLSARFNLLSSAVVGVTGVVVLITPNMNAAMAGFALTFASTIMQDLVFMVRRFVGLEQSMVALERVKEFSELAQEPPEFIEPRPPAAWPHEGSIECKDLVIRYAPELPNVLHGISFKIRPGEKVGILGRTGSGKSTLALSFFRFVEATEGSINIDGLDISRVGLTDLRSRLTIIPQDPTILSGTIRSTLDVFDEYEDAEIYEALRRVHLIPSADTPAEGADDVNANVFRNLDSQVSEGGENFSTGEKQLMCMARAILKRSKVLVMDEATASVDYATDELISKTIRHEFAESTILTIAHRLRTVIDYNRIMLLDDGQIIEFDSPKTLLENENSKFYELCKATGREEFRMLRRLAGVSSS